MIKVAFKSERVVDRVATGMIARKFREKIGASLTDVAREMGFSPSYISLLECGKNAWDQKRLTAFEKATRRVGGDESP